MLKSFDFYFNKRKITLFGNKTLLIPDFNVLVISDLHIGKATHFRKNGIAIPSISKNKDLLALDNILSGIDSSKVIFLGDLFHSEHNAEWVEMESVIKRNNQHQYILVEGNHDVLHRYEYESASIECFENYLKIEEVIFSHDSIMEIDNELLNISGHVHPGFLLTGKARNKVNLPCFYSDKNHLIMPAFGSLTGLKTLPFPKQGKVFPIYEGKIAVIAEQDYNSQD
ncbi:MAG: ligase-associated DNA damage response endonuclease PdeM [Cytophagales bacterium]